MVDTFKVPEPGKDLLEKANKVRLASIILGHTDNRFRIKALNLMADCLEKNSEKILDANNSNAPVNKQFTFQAVGYGKGCNMEEKIY